MNFFIKLCLEFQVNIYNFDIRISMSFQTVITKVNLPPPGNLSQSWLSCLDLLVCLYPKTLFFWLSNLSTMSVPDEDYSRNVS